MPGPTDDLLIQIRDGLLRATAASLSVPQQLRDAEQRLGQQLIDNSAQIGRAIGGPQGAAIVAIGEAARIAQQILGTTPAVVRAAIETTPVTLPSPPPSEYSPTPAGDIWKSIYPVSKPGRGLYYTTTGEMLLEAFSHGVIHSQWHGYSMPFSRDFSYHADCAFNTTLSDWPPNQVIDGGNPDPVDWSAWVPGQTLVQLLNSQSTALVWYYQSDDSRDYPNPIAGYHRGEQNCYWWQCDVQDWELPYRSGKLFPLLNASRATPPVWPGLANVTFGTPVALSQAVTITAPMDGVVVDITSVPSKFGSYAYDDVLSYIHLGSLSFFDDNGSQELATGFSFTKHLLCPKLMLRAAGVKLRAAQDVVGTVTPWLTNS